jgi:hypothetical protein
VARSSIVGGLAALLLSLLAAPTAARSAPGEDCPTNGPEADRCMGEETRRLRAMLGLPTVAELASQGIQVRRTLLIAGGRPLGALSFTRQMGAPPRMSLRIRALDRWKVVEQPIPLETWQRVLDRSLPLFEDRWRRTFYRHPRDDAATDAGMHGAQTCFHSWSYIVEVAETRGPGQPGPGSTAGDGCTYSIETSGYTQFLTDLALELFPACRTLDVGTHGTALHRLDACARLDGDREAAVAISNTVWSLVRSREGTLRRSTLRTIFTPGIVLRRDGQEVSGREAVTNAWRRLLVPYRTTALSYHRIAAANGRRGELHGFVTYWNFSDAAGLRAMNAPLTANFVRDRNGRFRIERMTLGAFERQPPDPLAVGR